MSYCISNLKEFMQVFMQGCQKEKYTGACYWTQFSKSYWFSFYMYIFRRTKVLYMLFDRFLLAVESRDLSQTDKILIIGSSLVELSSLVNTFFWITFVHSLLTCYLKLHCHLLMTLSSCLFKGVWIAWLNFTEILAKLGANTNDFTW